MIERIRVKRGSTDTRRFILDEPDPTDPLGVRRRPLNLAFAETVVIKLRVAPDSAGAALGGNAVVADPLHGAVDYTFAPADTAVVRGLIGEAWVTWKAEAGGGTEKIPPGGYFEVEVIPDLGP